MCVMGGQSLPVQVVPSTPTDLLRRALFQGYHSQEWQTLTSR